LHRKINLITFAFYNASTEGATKALP